MREQRKAHLGVVRDDRGVRIRRDPPRRVPPHLHRRRAITELSHIEQATPFFVYLALALVPDLGDAITPLLWLLTLAVGTLYYLSIRKPGVHDERVAQERLCIACLYDLADLPPDDDACTVCPECAGAWRLPSDTNPSD